MSEEATSFDVEAHAATEDREPTEEELGAKGDEPDVVYIYLNALFSLNVWISNTILILNCDKSRSFNLSSHCKDLIEGLPPKNKIS